MYADRSDEVLIEGYRKKFHPNQDREELEELWRDKGEQAKQDEFGNVGTFLRGARIGFEQTKDLIFDGGIRGLINYASGNKEQAAKDFERYQKASEETNKNFPQVINYDDVGGDTLIDKLTFTDFEDTKDFALQSTGQVASDLVGGLGLGGILKGVVQATAKKTIKNLTKKQIDKIGRVSLMTGPAAYAAVQNFGETYNELYKAADGDPDLTKVLVHGTVNSALDTVLPATILSKISKEGRNQLSDYVVKRLLKGVAKGAAIEGTTEATQTLSNELGKTDGWKYLENLDQVDVKAIEEAFAVGFFGGGTVRGATDTFTGKNPEDFAKDNQEIKDKQLMGALESVEKGGGLTTEPTIPVIEPVLEKSKIKVPKKPKMDDIEGSLGYKEMVFEDKMAEYDRLWDLKKKEDKQFKKKFEKESKQFEQEKALAEGQSAFREESAYKLGVDEVNRRLDLIKNKGALGLRIGETLEKEINNRERSVNDVLTAFNSGDIMNDLLPQSADLNFEFAMNGLTDNEGNAAQGLYNKSAKLLSLAYDVGLGEGGGNVATTRDLHQQTASHEAFHVLQDFFRQHDPKTQKLLDSTFGSRGQAVNYSKSPIAKWMKRVDPDMHNALTRINQRVVRPVAESGQVEDASNQGILGSELQAYAFQAYAKARRQGKTPVMASGLARYFNFIYRFLSRLGNMLRGYGFQNAQDVFEAATSGSLAKSFQGQGISYNKNKNIDEQTTQASSLSDLRGHTPQSPKVFYDRDRTRPISMKDMNQSKMFYPQFKIQKPLVKGQPKTSIFLPIGYEGYNRDGKNSGHGLKHILGQHNNEIISSTTHEKVVPFIKDVLMNGDPKKQNFNQLDRYAFRYKSPSWDKTGVVIVDATDGSVPTVVSAFMEDKTKAKSLIASQEDIEQFRSVRRDDIQGSSLPVNPQRVSSRIPSTKAAKQQIQEDNIRDYENPFDLPLTIGLKEILETPGLPEKLAAHMKNWSLEKGKTKSYNTLTEEQLKLPPADMFEAYIQTLTENLLFIWDNTSSVVRERSKRWYEGANRLAIQMAKKYNLTTPQTAAILAVFSPQKDWFQNISLAERFLDIHFTKRRDAFSQDMADFVLATSEINKPAYRKEVDYLVKNRPSIEDLSGFVNQTKGGPNADLMKAIWIRVYDEVNNPKHYAEVSPEGDKLDFARNEDGSTTNIAWQGFGPIMKAINISNDASIRNISIELGDRHKVRNFYNNISDPFGQQGDVTVDTHAVAATSLKPLGSDDVEVGHNLGTSSESWKGKIKGTSASGVRGVIGTYGLHAEAHKRAAKLRGVLPREMQSVTWEAVRGLFTSAFKSSKLNKERIEKIWDRYQKGEISLKETQQEVLNEAGGFRNPVWQRPNSESARSERIANNQRELDRTQLANETQSLDNRARRGDPNDTSKQVEGSTLPLVDLIRKNPDGFTVDPDSLEAPSGGFAVAPVKAAEMVIARDNLTESNIRQLAEDLANLSSLSNRKFYAGGWFNSEDGKFYLDATIVADNIEDALYIADSSNQIAIFDLGEFNEINTEEGIRRLQESGAYSREAHDVVRRDLQKLNEEFQKARSRDQESLDNNIQESIATDEVANFTTDVQASSLQLNPPKKTVKAYRILRKVKDDPDGLYPLFVDSKNAIPVGEWLQAKDVTPIIGVSASVQPSKSQAKFKRLEKSLRDGTFKYTKDNPDTGLYVPARTGDQIIVDEKTAMKMREQGYDVRKSKNGLAQGLYRFTGVKYRPGYHSSDLPRTEHLNKVGGSLAEDRQWVEVELAAEKDWQPVANKRAKKSKDGSIVESTAELQELPTRGFYRYKTNKSMAGKWMISGEMKILRKLEPSEVRAILLDNGVDPEASSLDWGSIISGAKDEKLVNKYVHGLRRFSLKDFASSIIEDVVDSNVSIRKLEEDVVENTTGVRELRSAEKSAYKTIEMVGNTSGRQEMIIKRGAPMLDQNGEITINEDTKGLVEIFSRLDSIEDKTNFMKYAYSRRAQQLLRDKKERLFTDEFIKDGLNLENDKYKEMFKDYQDFNRAMLKFMEQTGVISSKERENLSNYDYIPFYREIQEEFDKRSGTAKEKRMLAPQYGSKILNNPRKEGLIKKYSGGTAPIGDIVENTFRNAFAFTDAAMKNVAMTKAIDLMREGNVGRDIKRGQAVGAVNFVQYRVNGKRVFYDVEDRHLYAALASMTPIQTTGVLKHMETVARWFREFITHQPAFMVANWMRGEVAGLVTVDAKVTPIADSLKGIANSLRDSESIQEAKLIGGMGGYTFGDSPRDSAKAFERQLRLRNRDYNLVNSPRAITDLLQGMWGGLTKVGEATEMAYRDGVYRTLREQGKTKSEAAYEALNVINFNRKGAMRTGIGSVVGTLIPLVPFLNARIQGLYRTFDPMVTGRQANRKKTILYGTILTMAALALYSETSEDERYEQEPLHLKLNYHIFYIGDKRYLIPRAFEVGAIFTTLPEFTMEAIKKGEGEDLYKATMMTLLNTFSFNPTPQAIKPIIEILTNYDMFRGTYIDSPFESNYKPSARYGASTPDTSIAISEKTESIFGMSPNQITKLITGDLGSMGTTFLTASDVLMSKSGQAPTKPLGVFGDGIVGTAAEALGFGRFVKDETYTGNQFIQDFYETKKEIDTIYNTMNRYKKDGQLERAQMIFEENKNALRFRKLLNKYNTALQQINRRLRLVEMNTEMSAEKKRQMKIALINRRNMIGRQFDKLNDQIKKAEK